MHGVTDSPKVVHQRPRIMAPARNFLPLWVNPSPSCAGEISASSSTAWVIRRAVAWRSPRRRQRPPRRRWGRCCRGAARRAGDAGRQRFGERFGRNPANQLQLLAGDTATGADSSVKRTAPSRHSTWRWGFRRWRRRPWSSHRQCRRKASAGESCAGPGGWSGALPRPGGASSRSRPRRGGAGRFHRGSWPRGARWWPLPTSAW